MVYVYVMAKETWLKALILSFSCLLLPGLSVICRKGHAEDERRFHPLSFSKAAVCRIGRPIEVEKEERRKDGGSVPYLRDDIAGTGVEEGALSERLRGNRMELPKM